MLQKLSITLSLFLLLAGINDLSGQKNDADKKYRFKRVARDVKKEAKKYDKQGYLPFPGELPIKQQLEKSYKLGDDADENGLPKWFLAGGSSVATTQAAAEMQAIEFAKGQLVGLIETDFRSVVEYTLSNDQLNETDAVTVTKTIQVATNKVAKKLGTLIPAFKIYRKVKNSAGTNSFEVQVKIFFNYQLARKMAYEEMQAILKDESDEVRQKHEKFLNPERYPETIKNTTD